MTNRLFRSRPFLILSLLFSMTLAAACDFVRKPTLAPTWRPPAAATRAIASAFPTATPLPSMTPTTLPSVTPSAIPSSTQTPMAAAPQTTAVPTLGRPTLAIDRFTVEVEEVDSARQLTFTWETTGANRVRIASGTDLGLAPWDLPPDGTFTVMLPSTNYRNPPITLTAEYALDTGAVAESESQTVTIEWDCTYEYFFSPEPAACPVDQAITTWAAEQIFEGGSMLWLQEIRSGDQKSNNVLFVLYNDGQWEWYADTWIPDQPESDPTIAPPQGRVQPVRGFGKVWRENPGVRERLGWGMAPEQGYYADWQAPIREVPPGAAYIRTFVDGVLELSGWRDGTWRFVAPP